jgi:hypothetical protein
MTTPQASVHKQKKKRKEKRLCKLSVTFNCDDEVKLLYSIEGKKEKEKKTHALTKPIDKI